jgi:Uncharacterized protein conserved in bacteria
MRKLYLGIGCLCLIVSLVLLYYGLPKRAPEKPIQVKEAASAVAVYASEGETRQTKGPIDFSVLNQINEDIYAWLYIPGTEINHPVLQSQKGDNDYYLTHTVDHQKDDNGCLFTEYFYSDKTFDIPVTVIYGHRRRSGDMFGQLEEMYAVPGSLEQYSEIIVYTPEKELHYQVIGESEFSNRHIPNYYWRFKDHQLIISFLEDVKRYHSMNKQFNEGISISTEDKLLVLSTCLAHDDDQRFLVIAKLVGETKWNS